MANQQAQSGPSDSGNNVVDTSILHLAKVYATALLGAADEQGGGASLVAEMKSLVADVFDKLPDFEAALNSHMLSHEQREQLLDSAFASRGSKLLLNFLKVLSQNGRMLLMRPVATQIEQLFDESQNRHRVEVRLAHEAPRETIEQLRKAIAERFAIDPIMDVVVDPDLLGGIVIRRGDTVYDASVRLSLERLRSSMVDRAVEAIESAPEKFLATAT